MIYYNYNVVISYICIHICSRGRTRQEISCSKSEVSLLDFLARLEVVPVHPLPQQHQRLRAPLLYILSTHVALVLTTSTTSWRAISLRSYQCPWSTHCRSSSSGGCAPHCSRCGMLRSSTNSTH